MPHNCPGVDAGFGRDLDGDFCMACGHAYKHPCKGQPTWVHTDQDPIYPIKHEVMNPADIRPGGSLHPEVPSDDPPEQGASSQAAEIDAYATFDDGTRTEPTTGSDAATRPAKRVKRRAKRSRPLPQRGALVAPAKSTTMDDAWDSL